MSTEYVADDLARLQLEFHQELVAIVDWWLANSIDVEQGGFYGEVGADNQPVKNASKGIILNTRILWFFSEAAIFLGTATPKGIACTRAAKRCYDYIIDYFFDAEHGGVYWELDAQGKPTTNKKQVYAQAFTIYALTSYYRLTQNKQALARALRCFDLLESKTRDKNFGGYLEAFTRDWRALDDVRLSEKDLNYPKSQNTHLHVLEAYTTLNQVYSTPAITAALRYNIELFDNYIIDKQSHHLRMFMELDWQDRSPAFTYGHDIEASWLIAKALKSLGDENYRDALMPELINIAQVTLHEGVGIHGHVIDAYDFVSKTHLPDIVWWVQAEALVGFLFAYKESGEHKYSEAALRIWEFIKKYQIDKEKGEWRWLASINNPPTVPFYKVGFWKCPYHNGRAMLEGIAYLRSIEN